MNKLEENFIFFGQVIMENFNELSLLYNLRAIAFWGLVEFIFGVQVREDKTCNGNGYGMLGISFVKGSYLIYYYPSPKQRAKIELREENLNNFPR